MVEYGRNCECFSQLRYKSRFGENILVSTLSYASSTCGACVSIIAASQFLRDAFRGDSTIVRGIFFDHAVARKRNEGHFPRKGMH